jgi:hypothetical protein
MPDDHIVKMPPNAEILDVSAVINGYGEMYSEEIIAEEHDGETGEDHADEES